MEFYAALEREVPDQSARIVFVTGAVLAPSARAFLSRVPNHRLEKPFDVQELRAVINGIVR